MLLLWNVSFTYLHIIWIRHNNIQLSAKPYFEKCTIFLNHRLTEQKILYKKFRNNESIKFSSDLFGLIVFQDTRNHLLKSWTKLNEIDVVFVFVFVRSIKYI